MTALSPPGRVHGPNNGPPAWLLLVVLVETSTKTVLRVSSFMKRRKEVELMGRMVRSMILVGDLSMRVWGGVKVMKSRVWA